MEFVDKVKLYVKAGDGGNGVVAFLREKYRPKGGPAGGDGGKGGDVIFVATKNKHTLYDLKFKKHLKAENGRPGGGKHKHGKDGKDLIVEVPVGTVVKDAQTGKIIADLTEDGQRAVIAKGGKGGLGNARFATPTRQAPRFATKGKSRPVNQSRGCKVNIIFNQSNLPLIQRWQDILLFTRVIRMIFINSVMLNQMDNNS